MSNSSEQKPRESKSKSTRSLVEIFKEILTLDKEPSRKAAREVCKFMHTSQEGRQCFNDIRDIVNNAPKEYSKIQEDWRQENFVMAVSVIYYLHDREEQPDFLFPWLIYLLLHENGYIRFAAVRMIENEIGPLTYHIRFPEKKSDFHKFSSEKADLIILRLFVTLNKLVNEVWEPKYKKYKYVESLPSSIYKSLEMVLSSLMERCGEEYTENLEDFLRQDLNS